jgi:hypothetical protein
MRMIPVDDNETTSHKAPVLRLLQQAQYHRGGDYSTLPVIRVKCDYREEEVHLMLWKLLVG